MRTRKLRKRGNKEEECEISGSHGGEYEDGLSSGLLRRVDW
jgi:hypothetical protein